MTEEKKRKLPKKADRLKPLSLYPLTPEKALGAFMRVKPKTGKKAAGRKIKKQGTISAKSREDG